MYSNSKTSLYLAIIVILIMYALGENIVDSFELFAQDVRRS